MCLELVISALSGITGAAVGGFVTYKTMKEQLEFTKKQEKQKEMREDKLYLQHKREETYCRILRTYYELNKSRSFPSYQTDLDTWLANLYPYVNIYASRNIKDVYNKVAKKAENHENELIEAIRDELGIED